MTSLLQKNQLLVLLGLRFLVLPVTEGEFPIQQTPLPEPTQEPPVPDADGDSDDTDATVDYRDRDDSLLALAVGDQDVLIRLPSGLQG